MLLLVMGLAEVTYIANKTIVLKEIYTYMHTYIFFVKRIIW